jgi:hypothetical protein
MAINKQWHLGHRMPKNATLTQKIKWHTAHSKNCNCRNSKGYLQKLTSGNYSRE